MKEYTLLAIASVLLTVMVDRITKIKVLTRPGFYMYLSVIMFFKLLVNGFLTGQNIVMYDPRFFLGIRIGSIPLEDFFFGFSMVTLTIIFWEFFNARTNMMVRRDFH
jgi:lycopene cyclase domain-containing protein